MIFLIRITPIILEYFRKLLDLKILVRLYHKFLYCPNIIYIVPLIISSGFKNLNFLIPPKISDIGNLEKILIFVNSIEKNIALRIYLQTLLPNNLKERKDNIIKSFLLLLQVKIKTDWLKNFLNSNINIIICIDAAKMGVYILNIKHVI